MKSVKSNTFISYQELEMAVVFVGWIRSIYILYSYLEGFFLDILQYKEEI